MVSPVLPSFPQLFTHSIILPRCNISLLHVLQVYTPHTPSHTHVFSFSSIRLSSLFHLARCPLPRHLIFYLFIYIFFLNVTLSSLGKPSILPRIFLRPCSRLTFGPSSLFSHNNLVVYFVCSRRIFQRIKEVACPYLHPRATHPTMCLQFISPPSQSIGLIHATSSHGLHRLLSFQLTQSRLHVLSISLSASTQP